MSPLGRGPLWTRARLERVMCLRFGFAADQQPDTAAAAASMEVSRRTVQRWLHAQHGRSVAHIPTKRLEQLIGLLLPSEETLATEAQQARYATKAISRLHLPHQMGVLPAWEKQRWLEPHLVVMLEIKVGHLRIRQLAIGRQTPTKLTEMERRGRVLDQLVVPTRFHATVLVHQLLTLLHPWRFQAGPGQVTQGFTTAWMDDAPDIDLGGQPLVRRRRAQRVTAPTPAAPSTGEGAAGAPPEEEPAVPRAKHPDYRVDPDRGTSSTAAKRAQLLDADVHDARESDRAGLRELDTMVEGMAGLNRLQKDRERIFPRATTAELGHRRMLRQLPEASAVRVPLSARQRNERSKDRRAIHQHLPLAQLRAQRQLVTDPNRWQSVNDQLSDHLGDLQELPDAEQQRIRRVDRSIQAYEKINDRGHVVYTNVALPGYINAQNVEGFIRNNFEPGRRLTFDRYTQATHQLHETRETLTSEEKARSGQVVTFEMETRRGAYLGQSDKRDNTQHLLPRGLEFEVVGVHQATYRDPHGRRGRCLVVQVRDVTPEP